MVLLVLPKGRLCVPGQNQMCHLCGWLKLSLKKCGGKKNKKHRVGLNVGILAVPLQYALDVDHLSKWFVFVLLFKFWSVSCRSNGCPTIGYNVLCLLRAGFRSRVLSHVAKRNIKTKLQIYTSPQHVINTLLCTVRLLHSISFSSQSRPEFFILFCLTLLFKDNLEK